MSRRDDRAYLWDMVENAELVLRNVAGKSFEEFSSEGILRDAVLYRLAVIGEASPKVSEAIRKTVPELPWPQMKGMRNVLIHDYFAIRIDRAWDTIVTHLPVLVETLRRHFPDLKSPAEGT